ncbi:metallophosphoesterase [Gemella cuniculi]|uniref:metallophosphoesterase n=1 Tax=Gemella cuniculi TaxID=150240 RepID=UPI000408479B|nr:metallophosphoesterase [Gemella cuniculi]
MLNNWKAIVMFLGVAIFYEVLIVLLWLGLKWMITPFIAPKIKLVIGILFFIFANFSILGYVLRLGAPIVNYGNIWFFYFTNGVVVAVILLVARLVLKLFKLNLSQGISLSITTIFLIGMTALGLFWAYSPTVKHQTIKVNKKIERPIKIAMVADIHLGTFFGNGQLEKLNKIINDEKPDAIIIAGDIMDDDMVMYKKRNMGETLSKLSAPLGVYTVMGNHDNDVREITEEISKTGIKVLLDENTKLTDEITLVGRNDKTDRNRKSTEDLLKDVDTNKTTILIDHQPDAIAHHSTLPIDVQLSGHTHRGQIWPINYITDRVYVLDHGYKEINNTHFFTTSGYGFWGPPFKTTARSEVWMITIEGTK